MPSQFDQVQISDAAKFDGTLAVHLINNFDPAVGTTFQVVTSVGSSGAFSKLELPEDLADGKRLVPVLSRGGLTLVVADAGPPGGRSSACPTTLSPASRLPWCRGHIGKPRRIEINVLGQSVLGDFTFGAGLSSSGLAVVAASAKDVSASLGGDLVTLSDGEGTFFLTTAGVAASASVNVSLKEGLDVNFSGTVGLAINTMTTAFAEELTLGGQPLSVEVPAGPYVRLEAQNATLGVTTSAGTQSVGGSFVIESATDYREPPNSDPRRAWLCGRVSATFGSADGPRVELNGGQGGFVLRPEGVAAQFSGTAALLGVSATSPSGAPSRPD